MLNTQIMQSIECAIAHKCPKDDDGSKKCAHCEIGYSFVASKPVGLDCGHHVCKECDKEIENGCLTCKFCAKKVKITGFQGIAADSLFQVLATSLAKDLKEKYAKAIDLYEGVVLYLFSFLILIIFRIISDRNSSSQRENRVEKLKQKIKNEIDLKVDLVKDKLRSELHADVDRLCDKELE